MIIDLTFHISNASAVMRLRTILDNEAIGYGVRGKLFVQRPWGSSRLKLRHQGRVDLAELTIEPGPRDDDAEGRD